VYVSPTFKLCGLLVSSDVLSPPTLGVSVLVVSPLPPLGVLGVLVSPAPLSPPQAASERASAAASMSAKSFFIMFPPVIQSDSLDDS
jgi:hypothetical protein